MRKNWFEDWFDSKYYHILYKHRDETEAKSFISKLFENIHLPESSALLDLACGKGRHSLMMAQHGYNVTGIDLSPNSIEQARQNELPNLKFEVHDMREVYKPNSFNGVFNLFTSFGYFQDLTENEKVLKAVHNDLKEQGVFVIDFMNIGKVIPNLVAEEIKKINSIEFSITRKVENGIIVKTIEFEDEGRNFSFEERVQAISKEQFIEMLTRNGFIIEEIFGNYQLESFHEDSSDRLIITSSKK